MSDDEKEIPPGFEILHLPAQNPRALAEFLGLSYRNISVLAADGVMVRRARGAYDAQASTQSYIDRLRRRTPERGSDRYDEEVRTKRAQADLREMQLAQLRAELVPVAAMADSIAEVYAMHSEELHALEARLAPFMAGGHGRSELRREIDQLRDNLVRGLGKHCANLESRTRPRRKKATKKSRAVGRRAKGTARRKR